jgi:hypothetical protein
VAHCYSLGASFADHSMVREGRHGSICAVTRHKWCTQGGDHDSGTCSIQRRHWTVVELWKCVLKGGSFLENAAAQEQKCSVGCLSYGFVMHSPQSP